MNRRPPHCEPRSVALSLGSNLGDRSALLASAHEALVDSGAITDARASDIYETEPIGPDQPSYLNQVIVGTCSLRPRDLLEVVRAIEAALGRTREDEVRWGPRTIDIDILTLGDLVVDEPDLHLPHPELSERRFVLVPWCEVEPEAVVPASPRGAGGIVRELLAALEARGDRAGVVRWTAVRR